MMIIVTKRNPADCILFYLKNKINNSYFQLSHVSKFHIQVIYLIFNIVVS